MRARARSAGAASFLATAFVNRDIVLMLLILLIQFNSWYRPMLVMFG